MKFLYVNGGYVESASSIHIVEMLREIGHEVDMYDEVLGLTGLEDSRVDRLMLYIKEHGIGMVFSLYFVMDIALATHRTNIPYICILWDAPYILVYNVLAKLDNVWISTFDKLDRDRFLEYGIPHALYQPLSVAGKEVVEWNHEIQEVLEGHYIHEISFVGRLYEENDYDKIVNGIPVSMQYYFNSIFEEAAFKWDGINRVYGKTSQEILDYIKLLNPEIQIPDFRQDIEEVRHFEVLYLIRKIANIERITILNLLAEKYTVDFYTSSAKEAQRTLHGVNIRPPVVYGKAAALVFAGSKINLNISLKGIEGGTPQRIMDIMGAGGFVLSSYCDETAEIFEEDKEIVMFKSPEEMMEKIDYYLRYDREREAIAKAGYEKVMKNYTYEKKLAELIEWVAKGE